MGNNEVEREMVAVAVLVNHWVDPKGGLRLWLTKRGRDNQAGTHVVAVNYEVERAVAPVMLAGSHACKRLGSVS